MRSTLAILLAGGGGGGGKPRWISPNAGISTGELLFHFVRVVPVIFHNYALQFRDIGPGAQPVRGGDGLAGQGDYRCDLGPLETLSEDLGGDITGCAVEQMIVETAALNRP